MGKIKVRYERLPVTGNQRWMVIMGRWNFQLTRRLHEGN